MCASSICRSTHQARKCRLVSSGPLSQRILAGPPRWRMISSNACVSRQPAKLVSAISFRHPACRHRPHSTLGRPIPTTSHRPRNRAPIPSRCIRAVRRNGQATNSCLRLLLCRSKTCVCAGFGGLVKRPSLAHPTRYMAELNRILLRYARGKFRYLSETFTFDKCIRYKLVFKCAKLGVQC